MNQHDGPRYNLDALWAHARADTVEELAVALGTNTKQIARWRQDGLPEHHADRIACRLGRHPSAIWPEWWPDEDATSIRFAQLWNELRDHGWKEQTA